MSTTPDTPKKSTPNFVDPARNPSILGDILKHKQQNLPRSPQEQLHRFDYNRFPGRPWAMMNEWIRWQEIICKGVD